MAIVSFTPDPNGPPGAGWFADQFGNRRYAYDPVSAQTIAQQGQQPDQRLALTQDQMLNDAYNRIKGGAGGQQPQTPPSASDATPNYAPDPAARQGLTDATQDLLGQQTAAAAMRASRGSAISPGGFVPSARNITVSGQAAPLTDEQRAELRGSIEDQRAAIQSGAQIQSEGRRREAGVFANAAAEQAASKEAQARRVSELDQLVTQDRADLAQAKQEMLANPRQVDPNRIFSQDLGTSGTIAAALFRAIGTYAQVKGHLGSNPAGDLIDRAIDRDITAQRQAIEDRKGNVNNALAALNAHFGDLNLATKALYDIQHTYSQSLLQQYAAETGSQDVMAKANLDLGNLREKNALREHEFTKESTGLRSAQVSERYAPPAGGPPSLAQALENEKKNADIEKTRAETAKLRAQANETQGGAMTAAEAKMKTPAANALRTIGEFAPKIGMKVDPQTGEWLPLDAGNWVTGAVPGTDVHNAHEVMVKALTPELTKLRTGGEGSEVDRKAAEEELRTMSPQQLALTINQVSRNAQALMRQRIFHGRNQVGGDDTGEP